jgi:hypothetical protein
MQTRIFLIIIVKILKMTNEVILFVVHVSVATKNDCESGQLRPVLKTNLCSEGT